MTEFRIGVDLSSLFPRDSKLFRGAAFDAEHFPALQEAVREAAEAARARWRAYAAGAPLPDGHSVPARHRDAYAASVRVKQTGDFSAEVWSDYGEADALERGEPARDLKEMLNRSRKVKVGKRGRYLIIPFRWSRPPSVGWTGGPNEMDHEVSGWWHGKARSVAGGRGGAVFGRSAARDLGLDVDSPGKGRNQVNMAAYRPRGATGGAAANARFMTFRTMGDWQADKWIVPAKPALPIARTVRDEAEAEAAASFRAAAAEDLGRMVEGAFSMRPGGGPSLRKVPGRGRR